MQYSYELTSGRLGMSLVVFGLDEEGIVLIEIECVINGRGFKVTRLRGETLSTVCDFDSFLYPDEVEEEEIDLLEMLNGAPVVEDRLVINLCSMLCAQWAAGQSEEKFHETVRRSLAFWKEQSTL